MSTSAEQVARLLSLVPYLQTHPGVTVAEAARNFDITPAQAIKDLKVLWMCGLPGGLPGDLIEVDMDAAEGEGRILLSNADYLSRPMRFSPDEAMSLVVALRAVAEVATGAEASALTSALAKLEALTGDESRRVAIAVDAGAAEMRQAVRDAIAAGERIQLTYDGVARGETTRPVVDPVRIEVRDGAGYLQAWSVQPQAWRTFKLERVVAVESTGVSASDHGEPPVTGETWFTDPDNPQVRLTLGPSAVWITEYYPVLDVETLTGDQSAPGHSTAVGAVSATLPVASVDWLASLLLRLGGGVRAIDPAEAAGPAVQRARDALSLNAALFGDHG